MNEKLIFEILENFDCIIIYEFAYLMRISAQKSEFKLSRFGIVYILSAKRAKRIKKEEYFNYFADYMPTAVQTHMNGAGPSIHAKHT